MNKTAILSLSELVAELTDNFSEQISGGAIITPEKTAENTQKTPPSADNTGKNTKIPTLDDVGLTPFYPPLPTMKLARLGTLKGRNSTAF